ncbi:hypothetical protein, partial [Thiolapillus sp.]|uniref:hypothetical protein n=1 Tax=Thiolapillus sp. TaxID=2017437 RepID=UPI00263B9F2F
MTRTAGAPMGCQRPSRFWGLGCPKIYHEAEDTLGFRTPPIQKLTGPVGRNVTPEELERLLQQVGPHAAKVVLQ